MNLPDLISLQRLYGAATLPRDLLQELSPEGFHEGAGEAKSLALVTIIARHCFFGTGTSHTDSILFVPALCILAASFY